MKSVDVCIIGGGLAGLGLGIQLLQANRATAVVVVEPRRHPVPEAAHKVGESSVEIGAHYLSDVLGLREHLRQRQLPKLGLRYFFSNGTNDRVEDRFELGGSAFFPTPSYQLDRGRLENHMAEVYTMLGGEFLNGASVTEARLADGANAPHRVTLKQRGSAPMDLDARWLIDASGRASWLKSRLGLDRQNGHKAHAVWWRVARSVAIDEWSLDPAWQARMSGQAGRRWLSTNHLMGRGYWVWLIPLASGATSIGIVACSQTHAFECMNTHQKAMAWLQRHEPQCFAQLNRKDDLLLDFIGFEDYSYDCRQVFSPERWCITGEAGVFLDPFYSPGSDFIAIGNTLIADLLARESAGERIGGRIAAYNTIYQTLYARHLALYQGQYPVMGHTRAMTCKVLWDFAYYWAVPAFLYFHGLLCDVPAYGRFGALYDEAHLLNLKMQTHFRSWAEKEAGRHIAGCLDIAALPFMQTLNRQLSESLPECEIPKRLAASLALLRGLSGEIHNMETSSGRNVSRGDLLNAVAEALYP